MITEQVLLTVGYREYKSGREFSRLFIKKICHNKEIRYQIHIYLNEGFSLPNSVSSECRLHQADGTTFQCEPLWIGIDWTIERLEAWFSSVYQAMNCVPEDIVG